MEPFKLKLLGFHIKKNFARDKISIILHQNILKANISCSLSIHIHNQCMNCSHQKNIYTCMFIIWIIILSNHDNIHTTKNTFHAACFTHSVKTKKTWSINKLKMTSNLCIIRTRSKYNKNVVCPGYTLLKTWYSKKFLYFSFFVIFFCIVKNSPYVIENYKMW